MYKELKAVLKGERILADPMFKSYYLLKHTMLLTESAVRDLSEDQRIGLLLGVKNDRDKKLLVKYGDIEVQQGEEYVELSDVFLGLESGLSKAEAYVSLKTHLSEDDKLYIICYFSDLVIAAKMVTNVSSKYITDKILKNIFINNDVFEVAISLGLDIPTTLKHSRSLEFRETLMRLYDSVLAECNTYNNEL